MSEPSPGGKRILSLDGGGFRGLGCLLVVEAITTAARRICRKSSEPPLLPCEIFDLIIGSSTGGLLAVLLGRLGLDATTAIKEYKALSAALFGVDRATFMDVVTRGKPPMLATMAYEMTLQDVITRATGSKALPFQVTPGEKTKSTRTAVITYDNRTGIAAFADTSRTAAIKWLTKDIVLQATAAPCYIPPVDIQNGGKTESYSDGAYGTFINPTHTTQARFRKFWDKSELGAVVSLGQWYSSLPGNSSPTDKDARPFVRNFLGTFIAQPETEKKTLEVMKEMMKQASKTVEVDKSFQGTSGYYRIDPALGIDRWELVDHWSEAEVESKVRAWLTSSEGKFRVHEIATKLVKDLYTPPPAPEGTHKPHEQCTKPRPTDLLDYLQSYRVIFLIDDSSSMILSDDQLDWDDGRWNQARDSLGPIADFAYEHNVRSIDMCFLNAPMEYVGVQTTAYIVQRFDEAKPPHDRKRGQGTPTGRRLKAILDRAIDQLNAAVGTPAYVEIPPFDIIVLTDGEADQDAHPKPVLEDAWARLQKNKHHPNYVGVQIVQIGNSQLSELKALENADVGSIVDTVAYDGKLDGDKLKRILLGGLQPSVRALIRGNSR